MNQCSETKTGSWYCKFSILCNYLQSPLLFLIRLYWGWQFTISGYGKFLNITQVAGFFSELGIPMPLLQAYLVGTIELAGGLLLLIGLFSRLSALFLTIIMSAAMWLTGQEQLLNLFQDFDAVTKLNPFLFLYAALLILVFGPGMFSVDGMIRYWHKSKKDECCKK